MAEAGRRDVVVVGAGPVGLALALGLAGRGHDVLVLEKRPGTAEHSRAPAIWPGTQEILAELGVIAGFLREGLTISKLELWDVDRRAVLFSAPLDELAGRTAYPHLLILPQSRTEQLLLEALKNQPTADVRFSAEVTGIEQDEEKVVLHYLEKATAAKAVARFVAGCDGAHSTVRKTLGASFGGITYKIQAALADIEIDADADTRFPRITTQPKLAVGIRMNEHVWRLILPFAEGDETSLETRVADAVSRLFGKDFRTTWQSEFRLHQRISSQFMNGRIVLAGDAAHLNSPVGGQGMNAGIKDASLLIAALDSALRSDDRGPLAAYASKRREEIRQGVNRFTNILTRMLLLRRGRLFRTALRAANQALRVPALRRRVLRRLAMLE